MKSSFGVWAVSKMRSGHYLETLGLIMFGQFLKLWYAQQVPPTDELELKWLDYVLGMLWSDNRLNMPTKTIYIENKIIFYSLSYSINYL